MTSSGVQRFALALLSPSRISAPAPYLAAAKTQSSEASAGLQNAAERGRARGTYMDSICEIATASGPLAPAAARRPAFVAFDRCAEQLRTAVLQPTATGRESAASLIC